MRKKGGIDLTHSLIIFLVINVLFFTVLFIFVGRAGSGATVYEQLYSKQIALLIDSAKPGTNFTLDMSEAYEVARKNKYIEKRIVKIDPKTREVRVKLTSQGEGYSFRHFNSAIILWKEDIHYGTLYVEMIKEEENE